MHSCPQRLTPHAAGAGACHVVGARASRLHGGTRDLDCQNAAHMHVCLHLPAGSLLWPHDGVGCAAG
eukprot:208846-Chlamydomonas_euryale.AAC.2